MPRIVMLDNDIVTNWVDGDLSRITAMGFTAMESETAEIGQRWNGSSFDPAKPPQGARKITIEAFRDRLSDSEMTSIVTLAYSGAGDSVAAKMLLKLTTHSAEINLDSPELSQGLDYMVSKGALTPAAKARVLT